MISYCRAEIEKSRSNAESSPLSFASVPGCFAFLSACLPVYPSICLPCCWPAVRSPTSAYAACNKSVRLQASVRLGGVVKWSVRFTYNPAAAVAERVGIRGLPLYESIGWKDPTEF